MFKILLVCSLVVLISAKPSDDVPVPVSKVNEPKAAEAPQPVVKTSEPESKNEEIANEDQLKAEEDPDNIAARPLWLINRIRRTTTTTAAPTTAAGMSSAGGDMTTAGGDMTTAGGDMTTAGGDMTTAGTATT